MSEINSSNFKKEHGDLAPDLVGVSELTSPYFFVPPSGTTAERPEDCESGTLRFNTDVGSLEVFRGKTIGWEQIQRAESQYLGGGTGSNTGTGVRGLTMSSTDSSANETNTIEFITISTLGNSQDFGDLNVAARQGTGFSSRTRAIQAGGFDGSSRRNNIDFVTIPSLGNASDFGDLQETRIGNPSGISNQIRGMFLGGGTSSRTNIMDYITMSQTGNAQDFGDLTVIKAYMGTATSATRGVFAGGQSPSDSNPTNVIDFVTMASTGNSIDFGDLNAPMGNQDIGVASDCIRGLFSRGYHNGGGGENNVIEFITIATTGNGQDFGDCNGAGTSGGMAMSNGHGGL